METKNITLTGANGAATEPLDGGACTYGCTHAPAKGTEGRRFIGSFGRHRVCWQREGKEKKGRWGKASTAAAAVVSFGRRRRRASRGLLDLLAAAMWERDRRGDGGNAARVRVNPTGCWF
jgi:hypothetical protein